MKRLLAHSHLIDGRKGRNVVLAYDANAEDQRCYLVFTAGGPGEHYARRFRDARTAAATWLDAITQVEGEGRS